MKAALAYEFIRLRTLRSTWLLTIAALLMTLVSALALTVSPDVGVDGAQLGDQRAYAAVLAGATPYTPLLMGLLGAFAFGHEYRYGTMRTALSVLPNRSNLVLAKVMAIAVWSSAVTALGVSLSVVVLLLFGAGRFEAGVGLTDPGTARVGAGIVIYVALFALAGLAFGWLSRGIPVAVALLLAIPFMLEPLLRLLLSTTGSTLAGTLALLLPFGAGSQLFSYADDSAAVPVGFVNTLSPLAGGSVLAVVVLCLLSVAYALFLKRDA